MDTPRLVTAFFANEDTDFARKDTSTNVIMSWEQERTCLAASGNEKIRLWDLDREYKTVDIAAKTYPVSALHSSGSLGSSVPQSRFLSMLSEWYLGKIYFSFDKLIHLWK